MSCMKRGGTVRVALFAIGTLAIVCTAIYAQRPPRHYALIVGVPEYRAGQPLPPLPHAENDAAGIAQAFEWAGYAITKLAPSTAAANVATLPLAGNVRDRLDAVVGNPFLEEQDSVVVALSGHGVEIPVRGENDAVEQRFFFCPADADLAAVLNAAKEKPPRYFTSDEASSKFSLISIDDLYRRLEDWNDETKTGCRAGMKLLLVDACRNDPTRPAGFRDATSTLPQLAPPPGGVAAYFACSANQRAIDSPTLKRGLFFHHVIEGLNGAADFRGDGDVTLSELSSFVSPNVFDAARGDQTPELKGTIRGLGRLIALPKPPEPAAWPIDADAALASQEAWGRYLRTGRFRENSVGMKLAVIPPGTFPMGSPPDEEGRHENEKQVSTTISRPFWMGTTEVTVGQYLAVIEDDWRSDRPRTDAKLALRPSDDANGVPRTLRATVSHSPPTPQAGDRVTLRLSFDLPSDVYIQTEVEGVYELNVARTQGLAPASSTLSFRTRRAPSSTWDNGEGTTWHTYAGASEWNAEFQVTDADFSVIALFSEVYCDEDHCFAGIPQFVTIGRRPVDLAAVDVPFPFEFDQAEEFCQKLTILARASGDIRTDQEYRFPTEAEWEWACRAGSSSRYFFGEDDEDLPLYSQGDFANGFEYAIQLRQRVARALPNRWGLFDVYGSFEEWSRDAYDYDEFESAALPGGVDPLHRSSEPGSAVVRGGEPTPRSAHRRLGGYGFVGFRVVLASE